MRITPLDIRKNPFRKVFMFGFDRDAVNSFLDMVAGEFETLIKQNDELHTQLKHAQSRLEQYQKIEKTLNETLLTAQRATDEARMNAQKEAELIIKDAQIRSERQEQESRERVYKMEGELTTLQTQRDSFLARFKSMLKDQLALLEVMSGTVDSGEEEKGQGEETLAEVPSQNSEYGDRSQG